MNSWMDDGRSLQICAWLSVILVISALAGCSSFVSEGTGAAAGVAGVAIANQVTDNAAAATGIGLGVQAAAKAGLQYAQRLTRGEEQDAIAEAASALQVGEIASWEVDHALPLEPNTYGQVSVSRQITALGTPCKELVFSVIPADTVDPDLDQSFYVATVCLHDQQWRWASAEPATERWGSLQ